MKVNTKILMMASAFFMGSLGIIASFMPHELLTIAGIIPSGFQPIIIQVMGALYFGFAIMNWMSKGIIIGGIYARPLALGNFMHFVIGALALVKGTTINHELKFFWIAVACYSVLAILFGVVLFTHPLENKSTTK